MVGESDNWGKVVAVAIWSRGEVDGGMTITVLGT